MEEKDRKDYRYRFVEYPGFTVGNLTLNYLEDYAEERPFTSVYLVFIMDGNVAVIEGEEEDAAGDEEGRGHLCPDCQDRDLPDAGLADVVAKAVEAELARRAAAKKGG